jgi:hypothetical protein
VHFVFEFAGADFDDDDIGRGDLVEAGYWRVETLGTWGIAEAIS